MARFHIKICGITTAGDATMAIEAGADALGLNFYAGSSRYLDAKRAEQIVKAIPTPVVKVGVFVNSSPGEITKTCKDLGLDMVQLHGDEPPDFLADLRGLSVMKAFRCADSLQPIAEYLDKCHALKCLPQLVLIDAYQAGQYGGTGALADWSLLSTAESQLQGIPIVLAGGLTPANVGQAISTVRPAAVDTASGVEEVPGKKSPHLVREFVRAARSAFQELGGEVP